MSSYNPLADSLTSILSQRGPSAVPYDEAVKWNIREHVSELQKVFPTLTVKLSVYHSNDGRQLNVLKVEGTMPIHYQGAKYNIPILMWLAERYPYNPPQVYVVPTASMIVRAGTFVNPSGQVATPLLRAWLFPSSNLVDVVLEMSQVFGSEPPLYTRPAGYTPPPTAQQHSGGVAQPPPSYPLPHGGAGASGAAAASNGGYPQPHYPSIQSATAGGLTPYATPSVGNTPTSTPGPAPGPQQGWGAGGGGGGGAAGPYGASTSAAAAAQPPPPPPPPPPPHFGLGGLFGGIFGGGGHSQPPPPPPPPPGPAPPIQPPPPPPPPPAPEPARPSVSRGELDVHFRHLAIEALSAQLRALQRGFGDFAAEETGRALEVQAQLGERRQQLQASHDSLTQERMGTEQLVAELAAKTKALQGWLDRNEARASAYDPAASPASSNLLPADELCRQGLETQARDLAAEDAILALDRLLQTGQVPLDAYLKQVRALCRKQFFSRALGLKVAVAQQLAAAHPPPPAAGGPGSYRTQPYPLAHGDSWSHGVQPPPPQQHPQQQQQPGARQQQQQPGGPGLGGPPALHTGLLMNPLAGHGR